MSDPTMPPELSCDEVRDLAAAFVLGALDATEEAAVREHLAAGAHADAHPEISELGGVLPALADTVPIVEPPAGLRDRILAAAAADLEERSGVVPVATAAAAAAGAAAATAPVAGPVATPAPPAPIAFPSAAERVTRRARASAGTWLLRIAAVLVVGVLGGWNLLLQGDLSAARAYEQSVATVLDTAAQPGSLTAVLAGDRGVGAGLAAVDSAGNVALAIRNLAPDVRDVGLRGLGDRGRRRTGAARRLPGWQRRDGDVPGERPADDERDRPGADTGTRPRGEDTDPADRLEGRRRPGRRIAARLGQVLDPPVRPIRPPASLRRRPCRAPRPGRAPGRSTPRR